MRNCLALLAVDITDVPDGPYILSVATNWDLATRAASTPELNYTNNEARVVVALDSTTVRALDGGAVQQARVDAGCG